MTQSRKKLWQALRRTLRAIGVTVILPLAVTACSAGILDPQGPIASNEQTILVDSLLIMLALVLPTILAVLFFAWWFRASNTRARYRPDFTYSGQLELLIWSVPVLIIVFLSGIIWIGSHELDPYRPIASSVKPLRVEAVSLDWKWLFIYPDYGIASVNDLPLPAGTPIHIDITSDTVMNAFFIPQLGSLIYAMNGMVTQLNLLANHPGTYWGQSAHYSGDGFSTMHFAARAMTPGDFTAWVAGAKAKGPDLSMQAYRDLEKPTENVAPMTYKSVEASLFHAIATQDIGPGARTRTAETSTTAAKHPER